MKSSNAHKSSIALRCVIGLIFISASLQTMAQSVSWSPTIREIVIHTSDSTVKAYILIEKEKIETSDELFYHWYGKNSINSNMGGYTGSLLNGPYTVFDIKNNLITQGQFVNGLMDGDWKFWDNKGMLQRKMEFNKGKIHGEYKLFNESGELVHTRYFRNGIEKVDEPVSGETAKRIPRAKEKKDDDSEKSDKRSRRIRSRDKTIPEKE